MVFVFLYLLLSRMNINKNVSLLFLCVFLGFVDISYFVKYSTNLVIILLDIFNVIELRINIF